MRRLRVRRWSWLVAAMAMIPTAAWALVTWTDSRSGGGAHSLVDLVQLSTDRIITQVIEIVPLIPGGKSALVTNCSIGICTFFLPDNGGGATFLVDQTALAAIAGRTETECAYIESPQGGESLESIWRAVAATTLSELWCETDQGQANIDLGIDDGLAVAEALGGLPADNLSCGAVGSQTSVFAENELADGDTLDVIIESASGAPGRISICWEYARD